MTILRDEKPERAGKPGNMNRENTLTMPITIKFVKPGALGLRFCLLLALSSVVSGQMAMAAPVSNSDLEKLETKMFSRQYPNDPPEKRVERLELLVFGATQEGGMDERWERLAKVVKDRQNPESTVSQPKVTQTQPGAPKTPASPPKGNYPSVDALEWRTLKKTYKTEPIAERLSRLETKLLGQASPAMPLFDRVERLKKLSATVAAAKESQNPNQALVPPGILGPMPKGYPRSMPFAFGDSGMGNPFSVSPFGAQPFGGGSEDFTSMNRMMSEMMSQMNRQMRDLKNLPPGVYQYKIDPMDPGSSGLSPFKMIPSQPGKVSPFAPAQPRRLPSMPETLPPYADPNSI